MESLEASPLRATHRSVTLFWGRTQEDLYLDVALFLGTFITFRCSLEHWDGAAREVMFKKLGEIRGIDLANCMVYACGSQAMIADVADLCIDSGVPSGQFFLTRLFRRRRCEKEGF